MKKYKSILKEETKKEIVDEVINSEEFKMLPYSVRKAYNKYVQSFNNSDLKFLARVLGRDFGGAPAVRIRKILKLDKIILAR